MNRSKIEWCDYTINPVKGLCPMACDYCYARRMYKRFKWNPDIRYDDDWLLGSTKYIPDGSRIFIGSTMELFGEWIQREWLERIFQYCKSHPRKTFMFLTKQPQNLIKWSPFPENVYIGVTATDTYMAVRGLQCLDKIQAKVKFISFEPLLSQTCITASSLSGIGWLIIGQQTPVSAETEPKIEWVREIVEAADKAGVKVFLKDNLKTLLPKEPPFYTKPCADIDGKDPCYEEPCLSGHDIDECSKAIGFWRLRQELPGD